MVDKENLKIVQQTVRVKNFGNSKDLVISLPISVCKQFGIKKDNEALVSFTSNKIGFSIIYTFDKK